MARREVLRVALPVSAPMPAEDMCRRAGAALIWTKLSASHLMEVASRPGVAFAAGQEGGYIFPRFLPAYDAIAALVHTLALLATTGATAVEGGNGVAPRFHCPRRRGYAMGKKGHRYASGDGTQQGPPDRPGRRREGPVRRRVVPGRAGPGRATDARLGGGRPRKRPR